MSNQLKLSFAGFAFDLGAAHRITQEVSLPWHNEYVKADAVTRTARREEFVLNFLLGAGFTATHAAKVMAMSRTQRSHKEQNAYRAAEMKFKYHIVRGSGKAKGAAQVDPVAQLLAKFAQLTAAQQRKFLKAASGQ